MASYGLTGLGIEWIGQLIELNEKACRRFKALNQEEFFITNTYEYIQTEYFQTGKTIGIINKEVNQGKLIGYLSLVVPGKRETSMGYDLDFALEEIERTAHCESIVVDSEYKGHGLAKSLLAEAKKIAVQEKYHYICSSVHPENYPALISFIHSGYRIIRFKIKYNNKPRYILCLNLKGEVENQNEIESIHVEIEDTARQKELLGKSFVCGQYKRKDNKYFLRFKKTQ